MQAAAANLSIFPDPEKKSSTSMKAPPTIDHLPPEDGPPPEQPPAEQSINGNQNLRAGGFEKLTGLFSPRPS